MKKLKQTDYLVTPWKNGGGTTTEIFVDPPLAGFDFNFRVSIADIHESGAFSTFAGVDRTIALLEGNAVELQHDGRSHLLQKHVPYSFSGDWNTTCKLMGKSARDFNVMSRRIVAKHRLEVLVPSGTMRFSRDKTPKLIYVAQGAILAGADFVETGETLIPEHREEMEVKVKQTATLYCVYLIAEGD